jgi:hypothetical protein
MVPDTTRGTMTANVCLKSCNEIKASIHRTSEVAMKWARPFAITMTVTGNGRVENVLNFLAKKTWLELLRFCLIPDRAIIYNWKAQKRWNVWSSDLFICSDWFRTLNLKFYSVGFNPRQLRWGGMFRTSAKWSAISTWDVCVGTHWLWILAFSCRGAF